MVVKLCENVPLEYLTSVEVGKVEKVENCRINYIFLYN